MEILLRHKCWIVLMIFVTLSYSVMGQTKRQVIDLNGKWEIAQGLMKDIPISDSFYRDIKVPGLTDLAKPQFKNVAPKVLDRDNNTIIPSDPLREAFWYRKSFKILSSIPKTAVLKISKAKYGTEVFLNGKEVGQHPYNFTPGYFDIRDYLRQGENEIIVKVGASRAASPRNVADGFDYEKERYIPGIYDDVEIILTGSDYISNVQVAPRPKQDEIQVAVRIKKTSNKSRINFNFKISEVNTGKEVASLNRIVDFNSKNESVLKFFKLPLKDAHLWTPEDPFLYKLEVRTANDEKGVRFGMRDFHFDLSTNIPILNDKPYYLRGTNVTVYRFFEDSKREALPWDTAWVRELFKSFKQFHWNSVRFCIGLPPNFWYDIADEEGILVQDEYPIWYGGTGWNTWPKELNSEGLSKEYTEWVMENWNHPSVVIWDASNENLSDNEGTTDETGKAVRMVRALDLSHRPWDNGYQWRRAPGDVFEVHPYHFYYPDFKLKDIENESIRPFDVNLTRMPEIFHNHGNYPVINNEYGWLWLNRDGTPTTLTQKVYDNLLGPNSTKEERWHLYATYMAAETEFWRAHRKAAGVLIFTALGYSRPDGQTSDFFTDVKRLKYNDEILKYLPDAFAPVGIMLDEWGNEIEVGKSHDFKIITVNDLGVDWEGKVELSILKDGEVVKQEAENLTIPAYGQEKITIPVVTPTTSGEYELRAALIKGEKRTESIREKIPFK